MTDKSTFDRKLKRDKIVLSCVPFESIGCASSPLICSCYVVDHTFTADEPRCLTSTYQAFLEELKDVEGDRTQWVKERKAAAKARIKV